MYTVKESGQHKQKLWRRRRLGEGAGLGCAEWECNIFFHLVSINVWFKVIIRLLESEKRICLMFNGKQRNDSVRSIRASGKSAVQPLLFFFLVTFSF